MGEPCEGRTTHHAGCARHEARRDAEVAALRAQLATATASVQQLRADVELATAQRDAETCRADNTETERDVLRAQQAPLAACADALRAAATSAGWRDADASGETLVAWVRRGALLDAARIAEDHGRMSVAMAVDAENERDAALKELRALKRAAKAAGVKLTKPKAKRAKR